MQCAAQNIGSQTCGEVTVNMMDLKLSKKKLLYRWCAWFFCGNIFIFWLIGLNYLPVDFSHQFQQELGVLNDYEKSIVISFSVITYLSQLALLAIIPCLFIIPLIVVLPVRYCIFIISIVIANIIVISLVVDTIIYNLYRFHLNGIILKLVMNSLVEFAARGVNEQLFGFAFGEYLFGFILLSLIFFIEWVYAYQLWHNVIIKEKFRGWGKWFAIFLGVCIYLSYSTIVLSTNKLIYRVCIDATRFLPVYHTMLENLNLVDSNTFLLKRQSQSYLVPLPQPNSKLQYPIHPLQPAVTKNPLNLIIIVIDAWRFDMLTPETTPHVFKFAKRAFVFNHHLSGGNATAPGIFSLFYGIPATYWESMEAQHRGPILIDELLKKNFEMGIFSSASLKLPNFSQTVFQSIKNLSTSTVGDTPYKRDQRITNAFKQFIARIANNKKLFFSFIFYDAAHTYCGFDEDLKPFKPVVKQCTRFLFNNKSDPIPYLNRYKNALLLVDLQIKKVLDLLESQHLLDKTVVIITGDHGEEFNDNHSGYLGHASNFSPYQIQTPLIVYWPGKKPQIFTHYTSHVDIAPTLLTHLLGSHSFSKDYSVGTDLFDKKNRPFFIVGSYVDFGIVEPNQITTIYPGGRFKIESTNYLINSTPTFHAAIMKQVLADLRRFYK